MKVTYCSQSDIGRYREVNQDRYVEVQKPWGYLFAVADGFGHREGGQFASQTVVDLLRTRFTQQEPLAWKDFLLSTLNSANRIVYQQKISAFGNTMMGTTCVVLTIGPEHAYYAHIGDSRIYYFHREKGQQLTHDHSRTQQLVDMGLITPREAQTHPLKNILTKAIGVDPVIACDHSEHPIKLYPGDRFLLCSDGFWGLVPEEQFTPVVLGKPPSEAVPILIDLALQNGGYDNITVQVITVDDLPNGKNLN
ncbi:MAG: serine/threonine-protein phosphatase [FCB group bacterium]|nr:serine/threonine-protein phosphatase [FCB group bacterium]